MSKSDALETGILGLLFNATAIADLAQNDTTTPATSLYVSLHTADPGEAGTQATNETSYTSYVRVGKLRASGAGGWTVTGNAVSPFEPIEFPACTGSTATITHFGVGVAASGAGVLLYKGIVTPNIAVSTGVTPRLTTATSITED